MTCRVILFCTFLLVPSLSFGLEIIVENHTDSRATLKMVARDTNANATIEINPGRPGSPTTKESKINPPRGSDQVFIGWKGNRLISATPVYWETTLSKAKAILIVIMDDGVYVNPTF